MLDNKQHRNTIPERRETNYLKPTYDGLSFLSQSTYHILAKKGESEQSRCPIRNSNMTFRRLRRQVIISGASCVFTKLSCTCTGWDFMRMDNKESLGKKQLLGNYKHNNYQSLHRRLVLNNWSELTLLNTQSIQLTTYKQS